MTDSSDAQPAEEQSNRDAILEGFRLTILGTATPYPRPDQPCSGYLLQTPTTRIWVDAGSGTMAQLQRHIRLDALDALWISHLHPDHCSDLLGVYQWLNNAEEPFPPLPTFGPPGWLRHLEAFLPTGRPGGLDRLFEVHELDDDQPVTIGDLTMTSRKVVHSVPTFGLRAEHGGRVFAYSGDSGPCDALIQLARHANLFLCESGAMEPASGQVSHHCAPEDAARIAAVSGANRLLLTHLAPGLLPTDAVRRAAEGRYGSPSVAEVGHILPV